LGAPHSKILGACVVLALLVPPPLNEDERFEIHKNMSGALSIKETRQNCHNNGMSSANFFHLRDQLNR
jgi:hypothetical protein